MHTDRSIFGSDQATRLSSALPHGGRTLHQSAVVLSSGITMHLRRYQLPAQVGIKVNAYRDFEIAAMAEAVNGLDCELNPVECVMVGDSYFMTHLDRPSTRLHGDGEQAWGLKVLIGLVGEVRAALDQNFASDQRPFLLADLPDGATLSAATAWSATQGFLDAGADAVKVEVAGAQELRCVDHLARRGVLVLAHVGYAPQHHKLMRHGETEVAAERLFARARHLRQVGACGLVLEMISEPANQALARPHPNALPVYSIFSGRARGGGQSLNVWDAVVRTEKDKRLFPPTAILDRADVASKYTSGLIEDRLRVLMEMTLAEEFPLSPPNQRMPPEVAARISASEPWSN